MAIATRYETWAGDGAHALSPSDKAWASDGIYWYDTLSGIMVGPGEEDIFPVKSIVLAGRLLNIGVNVRKAGIAVQAREKWLTLK